MTDAVKTEEEGNARADEHAAEKVAGPEAGETQADAAQAADAETGSESVKKTPFTPDQQAVFDKRVGEEVAKTRKAAERATELEQENTTLKGRTAELQKALENNVPLHPELVEPEALQVIRRANELEREIADLEENWNGYTDSEDPKKPNTPEKVQQLHSKKTSELASIKERADAEYKKAHARMLEAIRLGNDLIKKREQAALKAKESAGPAKKEESGQIPDKSNQPGEKTNAKKGVLDRSRLPSGNKRTVMDVVGALG